MKILVEEHFKLVGGAGGQNIYLGLDGDYAISSLSIKARNHYAAPARVSIRVIDATTGANFDEVSDRLIQLAHELENEGHGDIAQRIFASVMNR